MKQYHTIHRTPYQFNYVFFFLFWFCSLTFRNFSDFCIFNYCSVLFFKMFFFCFELIIFFVFCFFKIYHLLRLVHCSWNCHSECATAPLVSFIIVQYVFSIAQFTGKHIFHAVDADSDSWMFRVHCFIVFFGEFVWFNLGCLGVWVCVCMFLCFILFFFSYFFFILWIEKCLAVLSITILYADFRLIIALIMPAVFWCHQFANCLYPEEFIHNNLPERNKISSL